MRHGIAGLAMAASLCLAQTDSNRVTVPLSDPNRPATIRIDSMRGDIVVRGHDGREVILEEAEGERAKRRGRRGRAEVDGLKRIDLSGASLNVEERENVVTVSSSGNHDGKIEILVPRASALKLKTLGGEISVDGVNGEIEATSMNGEVVLANVEGSVVAHSLNGDVRVSLNRVEPKPMSFSTMNGDIDVTLPPDIRARFKLKNDHGDLFTDFELKLEPSTQVERSNAGGKNKVKFDRTMYATVNGGGPEISFRTVNGEIKIRRKQ